MKDLTISPIDRQNILNNTEAITYMQEFFGLPGMFFQGEYKYTKQHIADFYNIDDSTIDRYLSNNESELKHNGYNLFKGAKLRELKKEFGHLLGEMNKVNQLGIFNFRSFLNLGMLLVESEKARALRSKLLDIVIDTLNKKAGGSTKYINQRDGDFFNSIIKEPHYRKEFTSALNNYLEMGNYKYALYTDEIYKCVFNEDAKEYKQVLQLEEKENPRNTMYSEILKLIASFETGLAHEMKLKSEKLGRKLLPKELDNLIAEYAQHPLYKPLIEDAKIKMASRDYGFRQILHENLKEYISSIDKSDYDRFLGEKSKDLKQRIEEHLEVFKRLKDR